MNNNYSWSVPIDKLMIWQNNKWMKYESKCDNLVLRLHCDQVLINSDSKVIESLNMINKIKGIYKQDILILFVGLSAKNIRKIKFQLKTNVELCLKKLGDHFPVMSYNASKTCIPSKYRNVDEVFQSVMTQIDDTHDNIMNIPMPSEISNFIRLCLLDPTFPQVVRETEKILKDDIFKNTNPC